MNINTYEYWEERFRSGDWNYYGRQQTYEFAIANVKYLPINSKFNGTILDFGCAHGDAIPVYRAHFPDARVNGYDISESAIKYCRSKYANLGEFYTGDFNNIPIHDIIVASHVLEHVSDDKTMVQTLLTRCRELFVFVPYKESPLYFEHVHYYDVDYYGDLTPIGSKIFEVAWTIDNSITTIILQALQLKWIPRKQEKRKQIIMFHFRVI